LSGSDKVMGVGLKKTFGVTLVSLAITLSAAFAEDNSELLRKLPVEGGKALYISGANAKEFEEILIAPLATLFQKNLFAARVQRTLSENFSYSQLWLQASKDNERNYDIGNEGQIVSLTDGSSVAGSIVGFPFGLEENISKEEDPKKKGQKILWNVSALPGMDPQQLHGIEVLWFGRKNITRQASGLFMREYLQGRVLNSAKTETAPELFLPKLGTPVEWRELLQLLRPAVVFGYANLTYRYTGSAEDDFWTYSPVLGRSRKSLESNRSDPLLGGELSLNDLQMFSDRASQVAATVVAEKMILSPFPQKIGLKLEPEALDDSGESLLTARGYYRNRSGQNASVQWNAETGTFIGMPGWVPTTIQLVPRQVWVIELNPKDPFSSHGTEVLFVDQETFLPLYKVIYDRKGFFFRFVVASYNLIQSNDERLRFPVPSFILAIDRQSEKAQALEVQYVRKLNSESTLKKKIELLFDIREHDKRSPKKENSSGAEANEPLEEPTE